ncbi:MAG TPA: hypothetical protein VLD57_08685, partial [Blastocatellia bacterium]|nr:hypothetical protein [Blastocatellia bacterium]
YKLTSPPLAEGKGEIRVTVRSEDQQAQTLSLGFYVQPVTGLELETPDLIDRIEHEARDSGGRVFDRRDKEGLVNALMELPTEIKSVGHTLRLRDSAVFAFLLPLIFAVEYLLRQFLLK